MTDNLPDYSAVEPPADTAPEQYSTHERRAALLRRIREVGSPFAINQSKQSDRFDVHRSTITRDMDRLRESVDEHLADDAKLTTRVLFESITDELLDADDWKAKKAAFDMVMDFNQWLADLGEQHREPDRLEADVTAQSSEVQYRVVRDESADDLPTDDSGTPDFEALGFAEGPSGIDVEAVDDAGGDHE
jgi:hypothetical protein